MVAKDDASAVPLIPSVMRCLRNKPYRLYLATKIPLALAALLPSNLLLDYLRYCVRLEDYMSMYFVSMGIALLSIFVSIAFTVPATKKYGKSTTLAFLCTLEGCAFLLGFFVPPSYVRGPALYAMPVVLGVGMAAGFLIPAAMLADVVDYDELRTGERSEGLYTAVETNVQQFVEIVGGVLPGIIASSAAATATRAAARAAAASRARCRTRGGAATPTLGTPAPKTMAPAPRRHWAGAGERLGSDARPRLLRQPGRLAACTAQPEGVQGSSASSSSGCPRSSSSSPRSPPPPRPSTRRYTRPSWRSSSAVRSTAAPPPTRSPARRCRCPATRPPSYSRSTSRRRSSTPPRTAGACTRCAVWWGGASPRPSARSSLVAAMVASGGEEAVVTFGCLLLAVVFILIPWDGGRLRLLYKSAADAPSSLRVLDDDDVNGFGAVRAHRFARELR